ncbi:MULTISPECIES: NADH-quinone oxidoreductase subunit J [Asticcacaulis]|uniref:NADH-quinone oxidoreductase subunit J n=1 Tax=Asticcacaulis TaxID=76890 RepID=UPI001AE1AE48|nr:MULTISPECIES: NADH-quinone oxidoreductase subunit J [Asticcacaulis]MBP2158241.1 NADH-quinone oxidoreductase subunit J [Asticcacaulis solisilvae]MDR6799286.1 NADH-quinone oxidoreductase subunit J [Asticcacaulis sp. BE141]
MSLMAIAFYLMAACTCVSGLLVVTARNPVHSVLFLILSFFSAAGLFVLLGAEFLAMLLIVVYVGAVAVLFLFVVMMLDVDFNKLRKGFATYLPLGGALAIVILLELIFVNIAVANKGAAAGNLPHYSAAKSNIRMIGEQLYTTYAYLFEMAGFVLLVAMIGAIVLTLRHRTYVKRQDIHAQVTRRRKDAVAVVPAKSGEGIQE